MIGFEIFSQRGLSSSIGCFCGCTPKKENALSSYHLFCMISFKCMVLLYGILYMEQLTVCIDVAIQLSFSIQ